MMEYNVYCDESCHLEGDGQKYMGLGALWLPKDITRQVSLELRSIKQKYGFERNYEVKWVKISNSNKLALYKDIVGYFLPFNYFFR